MTTTTTIPQSALSALQQQIWDGTVPLEIRLNPLDCRTYDDSPSYFLMAPRLSYLPFLLSALHGFFTPHLIDPSSSPSTGYFTLDSIPLKWHYPLGLLYDLFSGQEPFAASPLPSSPTSAATAFRAPWKLTLHFSEYPSTKLIPLDADGKVEMDAFVNSVKEADFLRNGTGKIIMGMGRGDVETLWRSVRSGDRVAFNGIQRRFLDMPGVKLRAVPLKVYLPAEPETPGVITEEKSEGEGGEKKVDADRGSIRTVQSIVHPETDKGEKTTLGAALHGMLPTVFPTARSYIHGQAVLHGAVVPLKAPVEDLMRWACYADGFLHIAVVMYA